MKRYAVTTEEILQLRRMTGEQAADDSQYSDAVLSNLIGKWSGDLHAAAFDVWSWKAAAAASLIDWSADGGDYDQSVLYDRYMANAEREKALSPLFSGMIIDPELEELA